MDYQNEFVHPDLPAPDRYAVILGFLVVKDLLHVVVQYSSVLRPGWEELAFDDDGLGLILHLGLLEGGAPLLQMLRLLVQTHLLLPISLRLLHNQRLKRLEIRPALSP